MMIMRGQWPKPLTKCRSRKSEAASPNRRCSQRDLEILRSRRSEARPRRYSPGGLAIGRIVGLPVFRVVNLISSFARYRLSQRTVATSASRWPVYRPKGIIDFHSGSATFQNSSELLERECPFLGRCSLPLHAFDRGSRIFRNHIIYSGFDSLTVHHADYKVVMFDGTAK